MKKILSFALPLLLAAATSRADLIWYDGFQYTNGSLAATATTLTAFTNSSSGGYWLRESGSANPSDMLVVNSNVQVCATGGSSISRQDDCCRYFATTNGTPITSVYATYGNTNYDFPQVLYASFTVICSTTISNGAGLPNGVGSYFASFYSSTNYGSGDGSLLTTNANGYGYFGRIQAFTNGTAVGNTWRLGVTDNGQSTNSPNGGFPVDLAVNTPYQVVEELDPITLQAATIWVNPINPNQTGSSPVDPDYTANDSMGKALVYGVNSYAFRQPSSFGNAAFIITNLAVATTFAEAMTNIGSTNAVAPVIVYQPPATMTNFPTANVSIPVVANGQGLASLNYQWQKSATSDNANPVDVSNAKGNSNIYAINGAQTTDSGYYSVVVTTPYGLSVTSAVCKLAIVDGPYPPQFTLQPVSQTLFVGQTATLSTTVVGPPSGGTPVFTWYSNNVVVTAGQIDNGYSSSYNYNSLITNNSATYKVAATNSYGGIVSSNAVLTVSPSPKFQ